MASGQVMSEEQNKKQGVKHSGAGSKEENSTSSTVAWRSPYLQYINQAMIDF